MSYTLKAQAKHFEGAKPSKAHLIDNKVYGKTMFNTVNCVYFP